MSALSTSTPVMNRNISMYLRVSSSLLHFTFIKKHSSVRIQLTISKVKNKTLFFSEPTKNLLFHQVHKDFMFKIKIFKLKKRVSSVVLKSIDTIVPAAN